MSVVVEKLAEVTRVDGDDGRRCALLRSWARSPGRGVLFDFNGTLSNDEPLLLRIYTEMFLEHLQWTLTPRHYYARLAGRSDREIIKIIVDRLASGDEHLGKILLQERRTRYCDLVAQASPILAATTELVHRLAEAGVPLGIVTGAQRIDVEFVLQRSDISGLINTVVTEEDVVRGKPDPEGFLLGAHLLGLRPADILTFEDSIAGIRSAKAAGMSCIAVEGTRDRTVLASEADSVISELNVNLLERFVA